MEERAYIVRCQVAPDMGEAARRAYMRRTTPAQRFDHGLELSDEMIRAVIERAGIRLDGSPEAARRARQALREAGAR